MRQDLGRLLTGTGRAIAGLSGTAGKRGAGVSGMGCRRPRCCSQHTAQASAARRLKYKLQAADGDSQVQLTENRETHRARHTVGNHFGSQMGEAARDGAQNHGAKRKKVTRSLKSRKSTS